MKKYILSNKLILTIALLFGAIYSIGSTLVALILQQVIDVAIAHDKDSFYFIVFQTALYLVILGLCYLIYSTLSKKFINKVIRLLRKNVFQGVFQKNIPDFKQVNSADYLSALTNDIKIIEENYFVPLLFCLHNVIIFVTSFAVMLYLSPVVMLCLFVTLLLLIIIPSVFKRAMQNSQNDFSKKQSRLTVVIKDFLSGYEVIHSYKMNEYAENAFGKYNESVFTSKYSLDKIVARVEALSTILGVVVQCSVLFVSAYLIITGHITAGALVALVQVTGTIVAPIQVLSQNVPKIQGSKPVIQRLLALANYHDSTFTGKESPTFNQQITLENVHFSYDDSREVIQGLDFTFEKGKKYALVGKSGCGKTTLINLITGYYAGFTGNIYYDNKNLQQLNIEAVNELSSIIHQNVYMFDESIRDNICLHKQLSGNQLEESLDISGVKLFLDDQKNLDSLVGENGNTLSGGQRQRIAVARALIQEKSLLILDEGTSAIDMQTAYDIESRLLKINELTLITITHSLNPELLLSYDKIIYMEDGKICEVDNFKNLVTMKTKFYEFYKLKK